MTFRSLSRSSEGAADDSVARFQPRNPKDSPSNIFWRFICKRSKYRYLSTAWDDATIQSVPRTRSTFFPLSHETDQGSVTTSDKDLSIATTARNIPWDKASQEPSVTQDLPVTEVANLLCSSPRITQVSPVTSAHPSFATSQALGYTELPLSSYPSTEEQLTTGVWTDHTSESDSSTFLSSTITRNYFSANITTTTAAAGNRDDHFESYTTSFLRLSSYRASSDEGTSWMTETERSLTRDDLDVVAYTVVFILMGVVGFLCNTLIIVAILRLRALRTAQNAILVNLCAADILIEINAIVSIVTQLKIDYKPTTCYTYGCLMGIGPVVIVLTMAVISRTQHSAASSIGPARIRASFVAVAVTGIWMVSIALSIPVLFHAVVVEACEPFGCCFYFQTGIAYGVAFTVIGYVIPNVIVIQYYVRIFARVRDSRRRVVDSSSSSSSSSTSGRTFQNVRKQLFEVRLAIQFVTICFVVNAFYLPVLLLMWIETPNGSIKSYIRGTICILYLVVPITNSILHFLLNRKMRKEISRQVVC